MTRAIIPTSQVRIIAEISWLPVSRFENSPHIDGMYKGHITIVRRVITTFSAPPANGMSIDKAIITSPKTNVKRRPTLIRFFSSA